MDLKPTVNTDPRRILPSVDRLAREISRVAPELPAWAALTAAKTALEAARDSISQGESIPEGNEEWADALRETAIEHARRLSQPHPRSVLNATGVVLHTNLGRAPLSAAAQAAIAAAAEGYSNLELDLETGRRGSRLGQLEAKLIALSGAEAAHVVNNNAAAVLLALNTLALGKEVAVSRGELVEIGGSFRVPAIMERAGVRLHEIGTTNRTHLADYENAIGPETALLLKVHRSNFEQRGFTAEADVRELAELAHRHGLALVEDLGSGTLLDLGAAGLPEEAHAPSRLKLGVDVVCFSGDKLLGGPQAGILLGDRTSIKAMRSNPLARALRVDKLTIAALDATLDLMLEEGRADEIPVVAGLTSNEAELAARAGLLLEKLSAHLPAPWRAHVAESEAAVGGGSLPEHRLPGSAVVLDGPGVDGLARRLREGPTPVLARVRDDLLWLDVRTLRADDFDALIAALARALH
jgi:L-seryl-tRNA(Ser) seleniumtransferase